MRKTTSTLRATLMFLPFAVCSAQAATLANRWSFDTDLDGTDGNNLTTDSVGGNDGVLLDGATVASGQLTLTGLGTGAAANRMGFSSPLDIATNYGGVDDKGLTIESWYTDTGTGTWGKLFHFGTDNAPQAFGYTHMRGNGEMSGVDRDGAKLFNEQISQNEEHHLVITVTSNGNLNAWVDGERKITDSDTNDLANIVTDFEAIGATNWNDPGMTGTVNEFRIWDGTLTSAEVAASLESGPDTIFVVEDSDGDGLLDSYELAFEEIDDLDQLDGTLDGPGPGAGTGDFDGDGLSDLDESTRETSPVAADTDEDDLDDGDEVNTHMTDPLNDDSDGDTLLDGAEINDHNSDPNSQDTDGDFYLDNEEIANGTKPDDATDPAPFTGTQLVHRYSFTTGDNQLVDSVGGNNATLFGEPEFINDTIVFDGLLAGPEADSFGFTEAVGLGENFFASGASVETWYTDSGTGNWGKLTAFGNGMEGTNLIFNLQRGGDDVSSIQYPEADFSNETRPSLNEEHHLVLTVTPGGEINAWVDGVNVNNGDPTGDGVDLREIPSSYERVGASAWNDGGMTGSVNEFRIYKGTLTAEDVAANFAAGPDAGTGDDFVITSITRNGETGAVTLTFNSVSGRTYRVDRSPDLIDWSDIEDDLSATSESTQFTDSSSTGEAAYYRIVDITN